MDNLEAIDKFMKEKRVNGQSNGTIQNQQKMLTELAAYLQKPFHEATQETINELASCLTKAVAFEPRRI